MTHGRLNWNVVRHDRVVGSGPREPSDLDALRVATRASAVLSLQHDECLEKPGIDDPRLIRYGRRLGLTMDAVPCAISIPPISSAVYRRRCAGGGICCARATGSTSMAPPGSTVRRWWC